VATPRELWILIAVTVLATGLSAVSPYDGVTWVMEAMPVLIGLPLLVFSYRRFPLTRLSYYLLCFHGVILVVGAHYTYARVPVGNWVAELLELERNHYDRFAHVIQGFVPAILAREIFTRFQVVSTAPWRFFLVCCFCLAFSALYEIIEWQSAVWGGDGSMDFLGIQGDIWDAQWDMTLALFGSILAQWSLAGIHDRQLRYFTVSQ
jgi:putative membrane protein